MPRLGKICFLLLIPTWSYGVEFNSAFLGDDSQVDLTKFAESNYVVPGNYTIALNINGVLYGNYPITYMDGGDDSYPCITKDVVHDTFFLKDEVLKRTKFDDNACLIFNSIPTASITTEMSTMTLTIKIAQAYRKNVNPNWLGEASWNQGLDGFILDYNINERYSFDDSELNSAANGVIGGNYQAWRLRGNWQYYNDNLEFSDIYAYRPIPSLEAKLTVGDTRLNSQLIDNVDFVGMSLKSDDSMLAPNLRSYAPSINGIAEQDATITVSQAGRVLLTKNIPAGPYNISDLSDNISGMLDVKIEYIDGSVSTYQFNAPDVPFLTRPGRLRYNVAVGQASDRYSRSPMLSAGEISYGVNNQWSLFAGGTFSRDYQMLDFGMGWDLGQYGAASVDFAQSWADNVNESYLNGSALNVSYNKDVEKTQTNVNINLSHYNEDYLTIEDYLGTSGVQPHYLNADYYDSLKYNVGVSVSQYFPTWQLNSSLSYRHMGYYDEDADDYERYSFITSRSFPLSWWRQNLNASLSIYKESSWDETGVYLSLSLPLGGRGSVSYIGSSSGGEANHQVNYSDENKYGDRYQLGVGHGSTGTYYNGFYSHDSNLADIDLSVSKPAKGDGSAAISIAGGVVVAKPGYSFHRTSRYGRSRILVNAQNGEVPLRDTSDRVSTNSQGLAVTENASDYYMNNVRLDMERLPDSIEIVGTSAKKIALTEGAIGYVEFDSISGEKGMTTVVTDTGEPVPFGVEMRNSHDQLVGLVGDNGATYVSGVKIHEVFSLSTKGKECQSEPLTSDHVPNEIKVICQ